jgi:uncharacterized protein
MKRKFLLCLVTAHLLLPVFLEAADPLRVFIRAGAKTHGPNQHDHPRFLGEGTKLLGERGMRVDGGMDFPSAQQLENTDVLVIYAADGMKIEGEQRQYFEKFLQRGGGLVVIHNGVVSGDQHEWAKAVQGGAWIWKDPNQPDKQTKWYEGEVGLYFVDQEHPITRGISNFDWKDEIYYDMDMAPDVHVLATSFHSVFIIAPQIWTYEKTWAGGSTPYRAFVSLPGHEYDVFQTPHYRAILLRGIAWAAKRDNVDEFCSPEELASLQYPSGGPIHPDKAMETMNVHPEFDMALVVSEPLVQNVISLDWDPQGRLWVAETPEYPHGRTIHRNDDPVYPERALDPERFRDNKVDRPARDRVAWLEDTTGDGRMDKKHVFADGLELVTSLVFYKDGVIVAQAPDILWIRDTSGDGKADKVETLYTGFGTFDTHAVINNFRWGLDGWIYSAIGYSAGNPKSPDGSKDFGRVTAGVIRFKPDGSALEQYASGSCNTWGFDLGPDGEIFYTTATCGEHFLHVVMPERILARGNVGQVRASHVAPDHQRIFAAVHHTRPAYVQIDWVGMFTAASGSCIYNGGAWPDRFTGSHFLSETTMSLVHHEFLQPDGVSYAAVKEPGREETEFITGTDLWFRPIHSRVGPDGAMYVVDFYNQAAIHNDTRGPAHGARNAATRPDRDHKFGRIYRVQHKQARKITFPELTAQNPENLIKALQNENGWVRETAARLLRETNGAGQEKALAQLAGSTDAHPFSRISALHTLEAIGKLEPALLVAAINDRHPILRKNALRIAYNREVINDAPTRQAVQSRISDSDSRTRLNAIIALGNVQPSMEAAQALVAIWPQLNDRHSQSAAVGVSANDPLLFIEAAFRAQDSQPLVSFVRHSARMLGNQRDAEMAGRLATLIAGQPASRDALKQAALEALAGSLPSEIVPEWNQQLRDAFSAMLASPHPALPGATLPLIARWDRENSLVENVQPVINQMAAKLEDPSLPDNERGQLAVNLVGVRRLDSGIIPSVAKLLGAAGVSSDLQKQIISALAAVDDPAAGEELIRAYIRVPFDLRDGLFDALFKRPEWSLALLQSIAQGEIELLTLGAGNIHRLRTHANASVAALANQVFDELRGPEEKEKEALIAALLPEVEKPGDFQRGKQLYTENCANCHVFQNEGRDLAPNLTGMGVHGAEKLLIHILDPNRTVEPNFISTSIETRDGLTYDGIIERENRAEVFLRNAAGDFTIRKDNILTRRSSGRSIMPEGYEALEADGLRDLITYLVAGENRFRVVDLRRAFTADSSRGLFHSQENTNETLAFRRFGMINAGEVPFEIVSPARSLNGNNVVVLKGGAGFAKTLPQKVEATAGFAASKLHFLGGVGGWAFPYGGPDAKNQPAAKVVLHFAGGGTEEIILRNGVEFADYIGRGPNHDVPGSQRLPDLVERGQVRWFTKEVQSNRIIERITLESFDGTVAPVFVAITAELAQAGAPNGQAAAHSNPNPTDAPAGVIRVLTLGGGDAHDFDRWFDAYDTKLLTETGRFAVRYSDKPGELGVEDLQQADVLNICLNQPIPSKELRQGILDFPNQGKGVVIVHAGNWINWRDWPEFNRVLVGGGTRSHDRYGEFEVNVVDPDHPVMKGVPSSFKITDELYHFIPDDQGSERHVLARATSPQNGKTYDIIWITKHPKGRIVCNTLGHDGNAHQHPVYQTLLKNSLSWAASP